MAPKLVARLASLPELKTPSQHLFALLEVDPDADARPTATEEERTPLCLSLVVDASSSMRGQRFAMALQAARDVVDSLRPADQLALITFDRDARILFGPLGCDEEGRAQARLVLDRAATGHGTNLAAGWQLGHDALARVLLRDGERRVLVLTDGVPSVGERNPEVLRKLVAEGQSRGVETTMVGVGEGIDEALCAALARAGTGRFHYLRDEAGLGSLVNAEVEGARRTVATECTLELDLAQEVRRAEVMHRLPCVPERNMLRVLLGGLARGQSRSILVQLELAAVPAAGARLGDATLRGRLTGARRELRTQAGYGLGAKALEALSSGPVELGRTPMLVSNTEEAPRARREVAFEVLALRTAVEVRSAWEAFDQKDTEAVKRRLGRARALREALAGLVDAAKLGLLPDVDVIEGVMTRGGQESAQAKKTFASWAHNLHTSRMLWMPEPPDGGNGKQ